MTTNVYTRQSSFSNGDVADANLINAEFDQLVAAFVAATGHRHDGTEGGGAYVPLIANEDNTSRIRVDDSDINNTKLTFVIKGTDVLTIDEQNGLDFHATDLKFSVTDLEDVTDSPVDNGFFVWDSGTVVFRTKVDANTEVSNLGTVATSNDYGDLDNIPTEYNPAAHGHTGSEVSIVTTSADNFATNDVQAFITELDGIITGLNVNVGDANANAQEATRQAQIATEEAGKAATSAEEAQGYAASVGVPTILADGATFSVPENQSAIEIITMGTAGTINLPASPASGAKYVVRTTVKPENIAINTNAGANDHDIVFLDGDVEQDISIQGNYLLTLYWDGSQYKEIQ